MTTYNYIYASIWRRRMACNSGRFTGLIRKVSIPEEKASFWALVLSSPVNAAITVRCDVFCPDSLILARCSFSMRRICRDASNPSITGIEMSKPSVNR